ncbi:cobyrinate a,c-diamide synthase [endosymbiont of Ridgeia piscesae]|jgi:cobyrinic acid a,c-diamide synthase|uniref:Cobyrinic acid a,c-diamide synthase n=1 Tax=endosymbiont of Ridgeia piscesae TaxID=54398 RepID=A0A0T5YYE0_9GAMM|nr:cobyrinate a,c-diamide synthase [endosymbiont of Ridgeia piscesae]KRT55587.1 cobyrinic acid a,c-diamide synthase [endosymbiont of Ridgeia piscesae]KRT58182.1 cobyrinic acid a,c-diamide synthase [endosymbiont of Ridgeia piscesae]
MSAFYISAAHKSSGKTTLSIGLVRALRNRGLSLQTFKKGPDYIDPIWLGSASGNACYNLDFYTQHRREITELFQQYSSGPQVTLVEGNKGLYDGMDLQGEDCNAAMAKLLGLPVILVINAKGITRGVAPLLLGYQAFDPDVKIAGVILNQVSGPRHETKLRRVVEHYTDIPLLGAVAADPQMVIDERHLGLKPSNEQSQAEAKINYLAEVVERQIDIEQLLENTVRVQAQVQAPPSNAVETVQPFVGLRIGYPADTAFGFYYPDDMQAMRRLGAELLPFDSLHDSHIPAVDGLFLGGGFPETAMAELEANQPLLTEIKAFIEAGGPVYAECGGLMLLCRTLTWQGKTCRMAAVIPADAVMHEKPQGRGYIRLRETGAMPWPGAKTDAAPIHAHEFHYSALQGLDLAACTFAYRVERGTGIDGEHDGYIYKNLLANYAHMRSVGGNHWVERFLSHVRSCSRAEAP